MSKPVVIHSYRSSCATVATPPGFGDFLRGTIALHQLAGEYGFDLQMDFSRHPLSHCILPVDPAPRFPEAPVHEFFNDDMHGVEPFLSVLEPGSVSIVTTHLWPGDPVDAACQAFMRRRIAPRPDVEKDLAAICSALGLEKFCSLHLRLGDPNAGMANIHIPRLEDFLGNELVPEWGRRILVLSDNHAIKEELAHRYALPLHRNVPIHLGQSGTPELPLPGARDAFVDFLLLARSERIYQLSVYPWGSGFSDMCSEIFGKPLVRISI